ncbi:MAG: DUF192 domain-containing protein [Candidatus Methylomirabilales bacterium]
MIGRRLLYCILLCLLTTTAEAAEGGKVLFGEDVVVRIEVARTETEKIRGLSGRERLALGEGMLFVYEEPARPAMWMRGMRFPLDILWIRNGRVVDLVTGVVPPLPGEVPRIFSPREEAQYVLEVPAGFVVRYGIALGDPVRIVLEKRRVQ